MRMGRGTFLELLLIGPGGIVTTGRAQGSTDSKNGGTAGPAAAGPSRSW